MNTSSEDLKSKLKRMQGIHNRETCRSNMISVKDALEVLDGKWKLPIMISLTFGTLRFKEIARTVEGISDRMLSKELKELQSHQLIKRTVHENFPPVVEYELTDHGHTLFPLIDELKKWGIMHRKTVIGY